VVEITGMEAARVLLLDDNDQWQTRAEFTEQGRRASADWQPIRKILYRVQRDKRTFWRTAETAAGHPRNVLAVVAAPILDRQGKVIGALYGERHSAGPTTEVEAMLVELLASGIATGLARLEQEQAALTARIRFEQFFTPEFSRHLTEQPDLLVGRDCEVSILFADIRGFSRISEDLGPARTFEWISAMLSALSDCVRQHNGVLVDYIGDELMAMWGAPETQTDHARLACQAALDMIDRLPELNARWQPVVNEPIRFNIGINTGMARVGNTGSRHKFKYGPLGNTVNLARRVQGATKYLHTNLLVTGATIAKLGNEFPCRRLCTVRAVNIAQPVDLYELMPPGDQVTEELRQGYEEALLAFQGRDHHSTACILGNLLKRFPDDGPSLVLLGRAVDAMLEKNRVADFVWELPGK
jgi:adenylate cyclase